MARLTPSDLDAGTIHDVTGRVLSGPAYEPARPGLLQRIAGAVLDTVAEVLNALLSPRGSGVGVAVLVVALAVVGLVVWRLLRRVRRDRARPARPGRIAERTALDWEREAERHAAAADWAPALRCRYRALLADLVAAGLVDEVAGRTARGYLREIAAAAPGAAAPMTVVTAAFEEAWYDRGTVTATDVDALRDAATAVRRHVPVHV